MAKPQLTHHELEAALRQAGWPPSASATPRSWRTTDRSASSRENGRNEWGQSPTRVELTLTPIASRDPASRPAAGDRRRSARARSCARARARSIERGCAQTRSSARNGQARGESRERRASARKWRCRRRSGRPHRNHSFRSPISTARSCGRSLKSCRSCCDLLAALGGTQAQVRGHDAQRAGPRNRRRRRSRRAARARAREVAEALARCTGQRESRPLPKCPSWRLQRRAGDRMAAQSPCRATRACRRRRRGPRLPAAR